MSKIHEGHRQRLKKRFITEGLASFEDHQALELLLFYALPRKDTNEIAHKLLDTFGSMKNMFEADIDDLVNIDGVGEHVASLVKLIPELATRYWFTGEQQAFQITSIESAAEFAKSLLYGKPAEHFYIACLDAAYKVKSTRMLSKGTPSETPVYIRHIAESAFRSGTDKVLIAHNHPGGNPAPSQKDIKLTIRVMEAMEPLGVTLVDHIIIANDRSFSFVAKQLLDNNFTHEDALRAHYSSGVMTDFYKDRK